MESPPLPSPPLRMVSCLQHHEDSAVDANNWFSTGDVATIDPLGFMRITDRSKDVIKSGGEWISSIDIENAAMSHQHVSCNTPKILADRLQECARPYTK